MSGRAVWIYDIKNLGEALAKDDSAAEPEQKRESSLKFMTRNVACMPGGEGWSFFPLFLRYWRLEAD